MHPLQPAEVGAGRERHEVRVTQLDRSTLIVRAPEVRGDTLSGFVDGTYWEAPLSQVASIQAREGAPARTAVLVAAGAVATGALLLYFGNRSYVSGNAQTCASGNTTGDVDDNLPVACCKVQAFTPC